MFEKQTTNTAVHEPRTKQRKRDKIFNTKISINKLSIGIGIGIFLTVITIALQCVAFFTPHWKEISPNTHSLYVDGVDALIRTEVLHYFNTIHRYTRHSYGLFERCEYLLSNSSKYSNQQNLLDLVSNTQQKTCTKNYLPSYRDEHFNECHSLQYYRFCTKAGVKNFDIDNDYLRATFDISSHANSGSTFSCACHYPSYVFVCRVIGIIALIFLCLTSIFFSLFPFFPNPHHRLKIKCFGILSSILSIIFLMTNLIIILQNLEYESTDYLIDIQRHYKLNQIYKLSQDTKIAIDRFSSSVNIRIGYSTILAWIAFILSFVDGILFLYSCRITPKNYDENETRTNLLTSQKEENDTRLRSPSIPNDSQFPPTPLISAMNNSNENFLFLPVPEHEKYPPSRVQFEDEV